MPKPIMVQKKRAPTETAIISNTSTRSTDERSPGATEAETGVNGGGGNSCGEMGSIWSDREKQASKAIYTKRFLGERLKG